MSYSVSHFYNTFIKEKILKKILMSGKIPTQLDLDNEAKSLNDLTNNFKNPFLQSIENRILEDEISSANKINKIFNSLESDLNVSFLALQEQEKKIKDLYETNANKIQGYSKKISKVRNELNSLLLESKYTDVHDEIFYEKFSSLDMIDTTNSNVSVDVLAGSVSLNPNTIMPISFIKSLDFIRVENEPNPSIIYSNEVAGLGVENITNESKKIWSHQIVSKEAIGSLYVDIILRLSSSNKGINKIVLDPASFDLKTQMNVEIAYSSDGLNWLFPSGEYKKRLVETSSFLFKEVTAEYWRIRFTKYGNDGFYSGSYVYNFGLKNLLFFSKEFDKTTRIEKGLFYSKPIIPNKLKKLSLVNLKVCDAKPPGTSLKYFIAPIDSDQLALIKSEILSSGSSQSISTLRYYLMETEDSDSTTLDLLKLTDNIKQDGIKCAGTVSYVDQKQNDYTLNFQYPTTYSKADTIVLRNMGNNSLFSTIGKEKKNKEYYVGWSFDGFMYSAYTLVTNEDGFEIDLGPTEMYLNGTLISGKRTIPPGLHHIATRQKNWISIDLANLPVVPSANPDPLYPYNHKYIIEGIGAVLYGVNTNVVISPKVSPTYLVDVIDPLKRYRNSNNYWAIKMKEVPFGDFTLKDKISLDVLSYKVDNTNQERIVVKSGADMGLLTDETFSIIAKAYMAKPIEGLVFKAILETTDTKTTPVLSEYMIKMK